MDFDDDALTAEEALDRLSRALMALPDCRRAGAPLRAVLAVSGGADSLAMLVLLGERAAALRTAGLDLTVATVDHGLRPEAAAEATFVAAVAAQYGFTHRTLCWRGWDGQGNLQARAREARYRLLTQEAVRRGASAIVTAHHQDDQIETHLLARLRGATGSALGGMRPMRALAPGVTLVRPFLDIPRSRLRRALESRGPEPVRDMSNEDESFARIRVRKALAEATEEARVAHRQAIAAAQAQRAAQDAAFLDAVWRDPVDRLGLADDVGRLYRLHERFRMLEDSIARRFVARAVTAAGGAADPPPGGAVERLAERLREAGPGFAATLNGCQIRVAGDRIVFSREFGRSGPDACAVEPAETRLLFDNRLDIGIGWDLHKRGAKLVVPFGRFGRGNEMERTLPVLLNARGEPMEAHPLIAHKAGLRHRWLSAFSRVEWRFLADLRDAEGRPPAPMVGLLGPTGPGGSDRLVPAPEPGSH